MNQSIRGDYFIDRLGGWFAAFLGLVSLAIVLSRFRHGVEPVDIALAVMYVAEVVAGVLITPSKLPPMRVAFWILTLRVVAGLAYMSVIHGDKLARSTLGFPVVVAVYCFFRLRALRVNP